jgi:hypothetical protein
MSAFDRTLAPSGLQVPIPDQATSAEPSSETGTVLDKGRGDNFCLMFWPLSRQLFPYAMKPTGRHSTYPCAHAYSSTPGGRVMGDRAGRGNNGAAFLGTAKRCNQWKMSMSDDSHYVAGG